MCMWIMRICVRVISRYALIFILHLHLIYPTVAVISVGFALISAPDMSSYNSANESLYI